MIAHDLASLKKHLSSRAFRPCYLLSIADDYERMKGIKMVLSYLAADGLSSLSFNGADLSFQKLYEALQSPSLFGGESAVIMDDVEKIGKKELQDFGAYIQKLQFSGHLILASRTKTSLLSIVEKIGFVLDLTDEKPWDKERRIVEQIHARVQNGGKKIASDAPPLLLERLGADPALLDQEIDKLICFVGDRPTIERSDVFRISPESKTETLWKIAEEMIWEGVQPLKIDSFYAMIPALRSQLQMGLKITTLQQSGYPKENWGPYFPKLWPKILEKRGVQGAKLGSSYFQKGLDLLFEIEKLSRSASNREGALFDLFRTSLSAYVIR